MKHVYFSGIGGVALGPLAEISRAAGYDVSGSDAVASLTTNELIVSGIDIVIDSQDGTNLREVHKSKAIDYYIYNASSEHAAEYDVAKDLGLRRMKRDELLNEIISDHNLKLIAVSGTHGKTTSTGMAVWLMQRLGIPVSYSIGTTLSFGPSGLFDGASEYFVYECDEFDRNFLHFNPDIAIIPSVDHDHFDIYPTLESYQDAFKQFAIQSRHTYAWRSEPELYDNLPHVTLLEELPNIALSLAGEHNRRNAWLVSNALSAVTGKSALELVALLTEFPGTDRRFERLDSNLYSDYGHHPIEIAATLQLARELNKEVVLVYQPHQNSRQYEIRDQYTPDVFANADSVYWVPTYLSREDPTLEILSPESLTRHLPDSKFHIAKLDERLWQEIEGFRERGALVLGMGAGTIDGWLRQQLLTTGNIIK